MRLQLVKLITQATTKTSDAKLVVRARRQVMGLPIFSCQMVLFTDIVRFTQPTLHFVIDFFDVMYKKMMNVITRRNGFYFGETRPFQSPGQNDMRRQAMVVQPIDGGEYHAHLEPDSCSGRRGDYIIKLFDGRGKVLIKLDSVRRLTR
jgi:hypothetical protein